jgi:hypothetical protein
MDVLGTIYVKSWAGLYDPASVQWVDQASGVYMFYCIVMFHDACQLYLTPLNTDVELNYI